MSDLDADLLREAKDKLAKATSGPWYAPGDGTIIEGEGYVIVGDHEEGVVNESDAEFIAAAPRLVRALVARVEELKSERNCDDPQACGELLRDVEFRAKQQVADLHQRLTEAEQLAERLKLEARTHAQEARTQRATVHECYQAVGAQKGDWNGAEPVKGYVEAQRAALVRLEQEMRDEAQRMTPRRVLMGLIMKWADEIAALAAAQTTKA